MKIYETHFQSAFHFLIIVLMAESALRSLGQVASKFLNSTSLINYQPVRKRNWTNVRPIMGWPRPHLYYKGKKYPEPHKYNWRPYLPEDGSYTVKPLPIYKMGGRDFEQGRVVVRTLGGGNPKKYRWPDTFRKPNEDGSVLEERVLMIKYDPLHSPRLALVADGERMRWIFATEGKQAGDIIRTYSEIPRNPVRAVHGDAHPLGALPVGTRVHAIEDVPGKGAKFCIAAGSSAEITRRLPDSVSLKLPNNDTIKVEPTCMAVVGEMSNVGNRNVKLWCPQRLRWLGKRPRSGQWHRKDGYCGKKVHPPKMIDLTLNAIMEQERKATYREIYDLGA